MPDDSTYNRRLGFWLRMARERAGKSQAGAAEHLGLSTSSKSTVSDWENGDRPPKLNQLRRLAEYYGVPLTVFTAPEPTIEERLDEIVRAAGELERADWAREQAGRPASEDAPAAERDRRPA